MTAASIFLAVLLAQTPAPTEKKVNPQKPAASESAAPSAPATSTAAPKKKTPKVNTYTFSGLDVEGKLKTPQLLYFLNRMKLEMDTSLPDRRSFMKELERSADSEGL